MFEGQAEVLDRYRRAGLTIGKIQVSAAVALPLGELSATGREAALAQLAAFQEPRYLHQTLIRFADQERPTFFEDLPLALAAVRGRDVAELRTHFHVPIYLERFGHLHATQAAIRECLAFTLRHDLCRHFEVETYAWGVLPPELRQPDLAAGIVAEMNWCRGLLDELSGPPA
jgi:hypothetical protein